ncbi:MAG: universal stress protein [Deltaproteobacteria bacterium]|nr:universal stress protein [Deltaproteobacteria bacterium]
MTEPARVENGKRRLLGNVLVATDFSSGAARAVARAARLPITAGSSITILHVLPSKPAPRAEAAIRRALAEQAVAARKVAGQAGLENVDVFTHLAYGKPFVEIIDCGRHTRAHLIVVGRHGQRAFRDLLLGSTAERVIRKSAMPVLVVSSRVAGPYRHPLVAVDGSETSRQALELGLRVAGSPEIGVVHAYGVPYESVLRQAKTSEKDLQQSGFETGKAARAMVETWLSAYAATGRTFNLLLRRGDPRHVILDTAVQRRADLLVLGTHGRSALAHALIGSVAEAVVRAAVCDVLVARPADWVFSLP